MVVELGMSDMGPVCLSDRQGTHGAATADRIDETTRRLLEDALARARRIVTERREEIGRLVAELLEKETLDGEEILACFPGDRRAA